MWFSAESKHGCFSLKMSSTFHEVIKAPYVSFSPEMYVLQIELWKRHTLMNLIIHLSMIREVALCKRSKTEKNMILGSLSEQHCIFSLQDRFSVHFIFSGFQQQLICAGSHFGQDRFTLWEHNPLFYHSIKNQYQKHYQYHHISVLIHYIVNNV